MLELGGQRSGLFRGGVELLQPRARACPSTVAVVGGYADIIAMRHPKEGRAPFGCGRARASVPIINAGDGGHNHPTQTLTDLLTIRCEKGGFENLTVGVCGDLKFGRTVHSLIAAMSRYKGVKFVLISPPELKLPTLCKRGAHQVQRHRIRSDNLARRGNRQS